MVAYKIKLLPYFFSIFALLLFASMKLAAGDICINSRDCKIKGDNLYDKGMFIDATPYYGAQVDYAQAEKNEKLRQQGYNSLGLSYLRHGDIYKAYAWINVALYWDKNDKLADANKQLIEKELPVISDDIYGGIFGEYAGGDKWNFLTLNMVDKRSFSFKIEVNRYGTLPTRHYGPASYGQISGSAKVIGNYIFYKNESGCEINIEFEKNTYAAFINRNKYKDNKKCEFGGNQINAHGIYYLLER